MTDIVKQLRAPCSPNDEFIIGQWPGEEPVRYDVLRSRASDEIERLRAENFSLAAWQCEFTDGKTGLVAHEHGGTYCAMAKENERLREALDKIATAKPQQIGDTEFQQGPLSLWQWAQRIARAALNPAKG